MTKHKKHDSKHSATDMEKNAASICHKANLAEKRAHKLVRKTLREMGFHPARPEQSAPPPSQDGEKDAALLSAKSAEKRAERLVQRTLNRIGWQ